MDPFEKLEQLLGEQAYKAFIELLFPGQIESDGRTNGPRKWGELPENYRRAINLGFGVQIDDSTQVTQQAQNLLNLRSGDERLLEVETKMRSNIEKLVKLLRKISGVEVSKELERYLQFALKQPCIDRQTADIALRCFEQLGYTSEDLVFR